MGLDKMFRVFYLEFLSHPICLVIALAYKYFILVVYYPKMTFLRGRGGDLYNFDV